MKKLFTLLFVFCTIQFVSASALYEYYLNTKLNNGASLNHGNYGGGTSFGGSNLGTVTTLSMPLVIDLVGVKTDGTGTDFYTSARMYYRIYKMGDVAGSYTTVNLPNFSNPGGNGVAEWQSGTDINLLTLPNMNGTYKVDVYFEATATYTGGGGGTFTSNISTSAAPLTASFVVSGVTLAAETTSFSAKKGSNSTIISWLIASEKDNALFQIERSANATDFSPIGEVKGQGNSTAAKNYTFTDVAPLSGVNYYRLKAVDYSGEATVSKVVSVNFTGKSDKTAVYPNPTRDVLRVEFTASDAATSTVQVTDLMGRVVLSQNVAVNKGANLLPLNVSALSSGAYFVKVNGDVTRFVKQ